MKIPEFVPVSDLRKRAAEILERLQDAEDPVVVTQRGRIVAVMQSLGSYEKTQREYAVLRGILEGELDIAEGKTFTFEEFLEIGRAALKGNLPKD